MINWLANALATRILSKSDAKLAAAIKQLQDESQAERKRTRELISEMEDVLEKFSRVVAREAMRRSREMKKVLDEEQVQEQEQPPLEQRQLTVAERKAALRARFRQMPRTREQFG